MPIKCPPQACAEGAEAGVEGSEAGVVEGPAEGGIALAPLPLPPHPAKAYANRTPTRKHPMRWILARERPCARRLLAFRSSRIPEYPRDIGKPPLFPAYPRLNTPLVLHLQPYPLFRDNRVGRHAEHEESLASDKDDDVFALCTVRIEERPFLLSRGRHADATAGAEPYQQQPKKCETGPRQLCWIHHISPVHRLRPQGPGSNGNRQGAIDP